MARTNSAPVIEFTPMQAAAILHIEARANVRLCQLLGICSTCGEDMVVVNARRWGCPRCRREEEQVMGRSR